MLVPHCFLHASSEASHRRTTGFVHLTPVVAYLQRLDGRQSISMRKIPAWRIVQFPVARNAVPALDRSARPVASLLIHFSGNHSRTLSYPAPPSSMPNRVKCQFGRFFQKFMPPERQLSKTLRKQNSHTGWKNGVPFLTAGKLPRTSDRQSLPDWKVFQEKGTVSGTGTGLHKGAARMSRIRLSQPQGAKRRNGQGTAATVTRCCSTGDDAVRNRVDSLRWNGR